MAGRFWAMMAVVSILSFMIGCAVGSHLADENIEIDKTGLDRQSKFCADQAEQAYQHIYREQQRECSEYARHDLCPTADPDCEREAVTFCRVATKLALLHFVGECLETPHFLETHETYL